MSARYLLRQTSIDWMTERRGWRRLWPTTRSAYQAAGSVLALFAWIYYSSQLVLLGAEFTHVSATRFDSFAETGSVRTREAAIR
jgi:uncharacterized BrkB/YihY/UPF0761 family membrane protein